VIKLGVIGSGPITRHHLDVVRALPDVSVAAICSRRAELRAAIASEYDIPDQIDDYRALLRRADLDGVLVLVAPDAIAAVSREVLLAGRPAFVEKPPGLSYPEAAELAEIAARAGTPAIVGFNRRHLSTVSQARDAVAAAGPLHGLRIEAPEHLARARAAGRSEALLSRWMYANSLHMIDLLRHLGGPIRHRHLLRACARTSDTFSVVAALEFQSGALAEYVAHWGSPGAWGATLYGRDITAVLSPLEEGWTIDRAQRRTPIGLDATDRAYKPGFLRQMQSYVAMIRSQAPTPPAATLADAAESMALAAWLAGDEQ
jgi:predicted dehydrogenase